MIFEIFKYCEGSNNHVYLICSTGGYSLPETGLDSEHQDEMSQHDPLSDSKATSRPHSDIKGDNIEQEYNELRSEHEKLKATMESLLKAVNNNKEAASVLESAGFGSVLSSLNPIEASTPKRHKEPLSAVLPSNLTAGTSSTSPSDDRLGNIFSSKKIMEKLPLIKEKIPGTVLSPIKSKPMTYPTEPAIKTIFSVKKPIIISRYSKYSSDYSRPRTSLPCTKVIGTAPKVINSVEEIENRQADNSNSNQSECISPIRIFSNTSSPGIDDLNLENLPQPHIEEVLLVPKIELPDESSVCYSEEMDCSAAVEKLSSNLSENHSLNRPAQYSLLDNNSPGEKEHSNYGMQYRPNAPCPLKRKKSRKGQNYQPKNVFSIKVGDFALRGDTPDELLDIFEKECEVAAPNFNTDDPLKDVGEKVPAESEDQHSEFIQNESSDSDIDVVGDSDPNIRNKLYMESKEPAYKRGEAARKFSDKFGHQRGVLLLLDKKLDSAIDPSILSIYRNIRAEITKSKATSFSAVQSHISPKKNSRDKVGELIALV